MNISKEKLAKMLVDSYMSGLNCYLVSIKEYIKSIENKSHEMREKLLHDFKNNWRIKNERSRNKKS